MFGQLPQSVPRGNEQDDIQPVFLPPGQAERTSALLFVGDDGVLCCTQGRNEDLNNENDANAEQAVAEDLRGHVHAQAACRAKVEEAARPADGVCDPVPEPDPACQRDRAEDHSL